ncbi:MAG: type II toxin-antitoxin system mRNA interferase toxin, RelE/StbE family [Patescibacteria group bacterium]|nr:type II toxin-antitoxin system mRNA interferase toxin, RelE/StbE family [Patescibacteria group bacterium]MDE1988724.1 type II toxin-antitoxin system mRNA interferase toxin, RelE/StbE family [Patescibacteria group bacterium]MDE2218669.1 type II toxin-antitoxin system mRNA interferase toxin, RelE/StbE family [Patescibacteria group bacterium]
MRQEYHKNFRKHFEKLSQKIQDKFEERFNLFLNDQFHSILNNHSLSGEYEGCRSINITGNIRAIFYVRENGDIVFINIGSHSELYE